MISLKKLESIESLDKLKQQYINQTTAALDGMWLCGFVPMATHYGFYDESKLVGYCCVNEEGYLLQFCLTPEYENRSAKVFELVLSADNTDTPKINGAFVSTAEPSFLSLCLDHFLKFEVNAMMYRQNTELSKLAQDPSLPLAEANLSQLPEVVEFASTTIGAPKEWLTGYYTNLINRQELFGLWEDSRLIATGESRGYDEYFKEYADLGVIVAESERGKGLATKILRQLAIVNEKKGLKSICSTEKANLGAQKAICRAGFSANNRIVQFSG